MAGESRFCQCPVCGVHIALLLAAQHVDGCLRSAVPSPAAALQAPPPSITSQCAEAVSAVAKPESEDGWGRHEHRQAASGQDRASGGSAWGSLKPPTSRDVRGRRRTRKAFDVPPQPFEYLVVLDYEWTCDKTKGFGPLEIIEFPSVLVKCSFPPAIVDEFQVYCRPQVNPVLSKFCTDLTGITQDMVDTGVSLAEALRLHTSWLEQHGLLPSEGGAAEGADGRAGGGVAGGRFAIVTWSDADVAGALHANLSMLGLRRPGHFDSWINLKLLYKQVVMRREACL